MKKKNEKCLKVNSVIIIRCDTKICRKCSKLIKKQNTLFHIYKNILYYITVVIVKLKFV